MTTRLGPPQGCGPAGAGIARPALVMHPLERVELRVSAAQLLLSELLILPAVDLERRIDTELETNTALELPVASTCPSCGQPVWRDACLVCDRRALRRQRGTGERVDSRDPFTRIAAKTTPRDQLMADAAAALRPAERAVAAHLLADVDDLGLLPEPVAAVAARFGVGPDTVRRVIEALRGSGAPGLCAESLTERLRLQVWAAGGDNPLPPAVEVLLARGLGPLADGRVEDAVAACGIGSDQLHSALAWIRSHVEAEPFGPDDAAAPAPVDVVVRRDGGQLTVDIVPGPWSAVRVAESYLAAAADPALREDIARARRFVDALDRRTRTILRVVQVVIARQARRVVEGPRAHLPLLRRDVAAELDLHESTVSRVVAGKQILLPSGETLPFGALFGAARGVQQCLRDLVAGETVPRSDAELAGALAAEGHPISRRTVAKYRAVLGIPGQRDR